MGGDGSRCCAVTDKRGRPWHETEAVLNGVPRILGTAEPLLNSSWIPALEPYASGNTNHERFVPRIAMESSITATGQISIPKIAREHLKVRPGDRVRILLHPNETVVLLPRLPASAIKGIFAGRTKRPVTIEEMDEAIERGAAEELGK